MQKFDVVIAGGAVMGSSSAYFLKSLYPTLSVCVVEPEKTYEFASTLRASGGIRRLFSCPENIRMSDFSIDFIKRFATTMAVDGEAAHVDWKEQGYLFIVPPAGIKILEANYATQTHLGANVKLLEPHALKELFPSMRVDDLGGAVYSPNDGWCDPHGLLQGFRRKARALGVEYREDRVVGMEVTGKLVRSVVLKSGVKLGAQHVVNAAGAWAKSLCAMVEMPLPIEPMRRFEHYFESQNMIEPLPYVKDMDRLAFRPEGRGYSGGVPQADEPRGFNFEVDHNYFEDVVWPALAHRFPAFESAKCLRTWSGLYEQNELDGNPVIGNWPGTLENFYVVSGFSGHGLMHAPAAGRAIAELIVHGGFMTVDLTQLGYRRIVKSQPYPERGII